MKVTRTELQSFFADELPSIEVLADAFTFHAFEIDDIEGDLLDIKVLPNRAADCSSADGVARELSAILNLPLKDAGMPDYAGQPTVMVTVAGLAGILGLELSHEEVLDVFRRLAFRVEEEGETLRVTAPKPRTDVVIPEDVAEEVGQILGYERVVPQELPPIVGEVDQDRFRGIERMKDMLVEQGFTEVSTQSFATHGDVELANPMDKTRPFLRTSLDENMADALAKAKLYAPRVLAPGQKPKLFEVGSVFPKEGEHVALLMSEPEPAFGHNEVRDNLSVAKMEEFGKGYTPKVPKLSAFKPFSVYPFMTRDVAFWVPAETEVASIETLLRAQAGELLVKLDQFDRFEKEGRVSYGFRLVFESMERTLTDDEVNGIMGQVSAALAAAGYEVR